MLENDSIKSNTLVEKESIDIISLESVGHDLFLSKRDVEAKVTNSFRGINKNEVLRLIEDVPTLYSFVEENAHSGYGFISSLVSCYNDYKLTGKTEELNQSYFYKFGLITKKEFKNGPSEELLKERRPISGEYEQFRTVTTTTHYVNSMPTYTTQTVGESFRFKFSYGNAEFKKGFLLSNLNKAMGKDEEAKKHIRKYRANFAARTSIFFLGVTQLGLAMNWAASDSPPLGLSTVGGIIALAPGLVFINWFNFFPQKYKAKNIKDAINTYNRNL